MRCTAAVGAKPFWRTISRRLAAGANLACVKKNVAATVRRYLPLIPAAAAIFGSAALTSGAGAKTRVAAAGTLFFATGGDGASDKLEIAAVNADGRGFRKLTHLPPSGIEPRWSTDGRRIVFLTEDTFTDDEGNWRMDAEGGHRQRLPGGAWDVPSPSGNFVHIYDRIVDANGKVVRHLRPGLRREDFYGGPPLWSPDGRFITINVIKVTKEGDPGGVWIDVIPTIERGRGVAVTARRYGHYTGALSWSPNSRRMLVENYPARSFDWYTMAPDGSDRRLLFRTRRELSGNHAWSPDSEKIAYVGVAGGIFVIGAKGGRPRRIAATRSRGRYVSDVRLDWSARGEIAFTDKGGTYVMGADGTGLRRLSKRTGNPHWSPNGRKLVLAEAKQIFVIDRRGRERQLTRWVADGEPQVSSDGRRVTFVRGRGVYLESPSVYVMNSAGTGRRRLGPGERPRWSPDSSRIAYVRDRAVPENDRIFVADAGGGGTRAIANGEEPAWSPDGRLAFMRYDYVYENRGEHGGAQWYLVKSTLLIANADGSGERAVAAFDADSDEGPIAASAPAWSPDGRTVALVFGGSVVLVDAVDGTRRALAGSSPDTLEWSPDGSHILARNYNTIWVIDAATGATTKVLELEEDEFQDATWSPDDAMIGFVRCNLDEDVCDVYTVAAQAGAKPQRLTRTVGIERNLDWGP